MSIKIVNIKVESNYDVYCGRANRHYNLEQSIFHNPFPIELDRNRTQAIQEFKKYFYDRIENDIEFKKQVLSIRGKTCGCWCKPLECHVDIIKEYLDNIRINKKYKLAVIGSRSVTDEKLVFDYLDSKKDKIEMVVSGGCTGPDEISRRWCQLRGYPCLIYYPKWHDEQGNYNRGAGFQRNSLIIKNSDLCVAFWDKQSKGTLNSIEWCKKLGKPIKIIDCPIESQIEQPDF
jgi:hypothetical protein